MGGFKIRLKRKKDPDVRFSHAGYETPKYLGAPPSEAHEQMAIVQWADSMSRSTYSDLGALYAIPNGGSRHPVEAKNMKLAGVKSGVPDMFLPVARRGYHGLYIELKRRDVNVVSANQYEWLCKLHMRDYLVEVCRGYDEATKVLTWYLSGTGKYPMGEGVKFLMKKCEIETWLHLKIKPGVPQ